MRKLLNSNSDNLLIVKSLRDQLNNFFDNYPSYAFLKTLTFFEAAAGIVIPAFHPCLIH